MKNVKIYNAMDGIEADMIINMLKEENIPAYSLGAGAGDFLEIKYGFSVYGKDIYVEEKNKEKALALISEISENCRGSIADARDWETDIADARDWENDETEVAEAVTPTFGGQKESETEKGLYPWYKRKRTVARVILALMFLFFALPYILPKII